MPGCRPFRKLIYDRYNVFEEEIEKILQAVREEDLPIPEYARDIHTRKGRYMGKTKKDFFLEENKALKPRAMGLFDDVVK